MPVKKDASGRRWVELEFEVPGTPEQVWQAIATGPGMSAWFTPTVVEERVGGAMTFDLGPEMQSAAQVTVWEPPQRLGYEERDWSGEAPPLATEVVVETRSGGRCVVRMVHSLFTSRADWDDELESMERGWPGFIEVLRVYLAHFPGWRAASVRAMGRCQGSEAEAFEALRTKLGLSDVAVGDRRRVTLEDGPSFAGLVERVEPKELMLRLDRPSAGVALFGAFTWDQKVQIAVSAYFYGDDADALAAREERAWQAWLDRHFE